MLDSYIEKHGRRIYGLCRHLCASESEAQDLYQETWLRAFANFHRYDSNRDFEPWLTRICVNLFRTQLRRRGRLVTLSTDDETLSRDIPATENEDYSNLYVAIDSLPEKLRMTVVLFYFRDMDISSTAKVLGVPEGTIKSRLNKARKLIKEVLTSETDI